MILAAYRSGRPSATREPGKACVEGRIGLPGAGSLASSLGNGGMSPDHGVLTF
jgi:hypothetical protein